jgi:hypothetical protein
MTMATVEQLLARLGAGIMTVAFITCMNPDHANPLANRSDP